MKKMGMRSWNKKSNLKTFFFSMLVAGGMLMVSCEKDDDAPQPQSSEPGIIRTQSVNGTTTTTTTTVGTPGLSDNANTNTNPNTADTTDFPSTKAREVFNGMAGFTRDSISQINGNINPTTNEAVSTANGTNGSRPGI